MISKIKELYNFRELLRALVKKELKVKYKNSALGFLWSFINPLIMAVVYTLIFGFLLKGRHSQKDFPLFLLAGLLPWNFFSIAVATSAASIIANANLIKKVRFPKEIIPLSIVFAGLVNFLMEMAVILVVFRLWGYNFIPYLPIFILAVLLQLVITAGFCLLFASLTVYFRDIEQIISIVLTIWFFATPIVYDISLVYNASSIVATGLKIANPMVAIVLLYRQTLYYNAWPTLNLLLYALFGSAIIFCFGYLVFRKLSPNFAKEV